MGSNGPTNRKSGESWVGTQESWGRSSLTPRISEEGMVWQFRRLGRSGLVHRRSGGGMSGIALHSRV